MSGLTERIIRRAAEALQRRDPALAAARVIKHHAEEMAGRDEFGRS